MPNFWFRSLFQALIAAKRLFQYWYQHGTPLGSSSNEEYLSIIIILVVKCNLFFFCISFTSFREQSPIQFYLTVPHAKYPRCHMCTEISRLVEKLLNKTWLSGSSVQSSIFRKIYKVIHFKGSWFLTASLIQVETAPTYTTKSPQYLTTSASTRVSRYTPEIPNFLKISIPHVSETWFWKNTHVCCSWSNWHLENEWRSLTVCIYF